MKSLKCTQIADAIIILHFIIFPEKFTRNWRWSGFTEKIQNQQWFYDWPACRQSISEKHQTSLPLFLSDCFSSPEQPDRHGNHCKYFQFLPKVILFFVKLIFPSFPGKCGTNIWICLQIFSMVQNSTKQLEKFDPPYFKF